MKEYVLIEDRGCNIRYEIASSDNVNGLIVQAINASENEDNVNGDNEPFRYEIWDGGEEIWSSLRDMPIAIGLYENQGYGPYTVDQVDSREWSGKNYADRLIFPEDGESIFDLCHKYGIDCF